MKKIEKWIDGLGVLLSIIGTVGLLFMMMYTVLSVSARFFTGKPLLGTIEIGSVLLPIVASCFYIYTDMRDRHIRATIVYDHFSPRCRQYLDALFSLITAAIFIIVSWRAVFYGMRSMRIGAETSVLALPLHPFHFVYGFILMVFSAYMLLKCIRLVFSSGQLIEKTAG